MGEVAYADIVAEFEHAFEVYFIHYGLYHGRLTLAVATCKSDLVATVDGECGVLKHRLAVVTLAYPFGDDGIVAAAWRRREFETESRGVFLVHLDNLKFFEPLLFALHLKCLGIGAFEPLDKLARLGNLFLLVVELLDLLLASFLAKFEIVAVGCLVVVDAARVTSMVRVVMLSINRRS